MTIPDAAIASALHAALGGVRALVLDADGVIVLKGRPLPGAIDALRRLDELGVPYRVVTNFSLSHRETLAERLRADGLPATSGRIVTAASAAAAVTRQRFPDGPLFVLAAPDALREFDGQRLLAVEDARAPDARAAAVVIGDAGDELSYRNLDAAFRLVRGGAEFLAMHRNPWWLTPRGVTLDAGAAVAGLEYALGRRATVLGKPSLTVFREAVRELAADVGVRRLAARSVAMVGDDLRADLAPARRLGLRTILVLTGKVGPEEVDDAVARGRFRPDAIAASLPDVVAALAD